MKRFIGKTSLVSSLSELYLMRKFEHGIAHHRSFSTTLGLEKKRTSIDSLLSSMEKSSGTKTKPISKKSSPTTKSKTNTTEKVAQTTSKTKSSPVKKPSLPSSS